TGATGVCECPCPVAGSFRYLVGGFNTPAGPVIAANQTLPYLPIGTSNTSGAFTITNDGCIRVNECGIYNIDIRVQTNQAASFCISVNGGSPGSLSGGSVCACGTIYISSLYRLNAGDIVCVFNCSGQSATLLGSVTGAGGLITAQSVINFTQICPC
ncbi:hypothetical protein, partial [Bacillus thuringiensis]